MSEMPTVSRSDGKLHLNESAEARVRLFAERHGEDPKRVIAEVERGLPLGRLFLRVLEIDVPEVRNGRASDDATFRARYFSLQRAVAQYDKADAKGIARAISATAKQLNISASTARTILNGRTDKEGKTEGGVARAYWQPLDEVEDVEVAVPPCDPLFKES